MNQKGYALVEVIVVVLLSSIIGSYVIVGTDFLEELRFKTLISEVERGIRQAQRRAVATGKIMQVYCTKEKIYIREGWKVADYTIAIDKGIILPTKDAQGNAVSGKVIYFNGSMRPSKSGTITLIHEKLKAGGRSVVKELGKITP